MSVQTPARELVTVALLSIDRPELDARIDRDESYLDELGHDIESRGLIYPLIVVRTGERFELVDGYTRYQAMRRRGILQAECLVYPTKELALEGVKWASNIWRLEMTPADEAVYFTQLLQVECRGDIEKLAALTRKKISYLDNRLALLAGDPEIFEALKNKQISIGVANELNKCSDEMYRRYFLAHAVKGGATVSVVCGWVTEWKNAQAAAVNVPAPPAAETVVVPGAAHDPFQCYVCRKSDPRFIPEQLAIHTHCKHAILEPMLAAYHGETS